ncbi:hypothetical protein D3C73_1461950 [compost metagenome]
MLGHFSNLISPAIPVTGEVALRVGGDLEQVAVPERGLLRLRHGEPGLGDPFAHSVGFHVHDAHVHAKLLKRFRLAIHPREDFVKRIIRAEVVE